MHYVERVDRNQMLMLSLDLLVKEDSTARLIDEFVESLDLRGYGFKEIAREGRPPYDPKALLKLYIYGSERGIRSSRKLARCCEENVEVIWMLGGVTPDFRTISDFRKENIDAMRGVFLEFNRRLGRAVEWGFASVDGSKFAACNSKERNFTKSKLDDRIKWLNGHIEEYMRVLDEADGREDAEEGQLTRAMELVRDRLEDSEERLRLYEGYREIMEESGQAQMSLTDPDARLMKSKNGFAVAYNPQTAVDSETHIIRDFQMTNRVTDHGLLATTLEGIKGGTDGVVEAVADRGYENCGDMAKCLEAGIIPHVITRDGKDGHEIEIAYEEADADASSVEPGELSKALHAGVVPDAYRDVITDIEVVERRKKVSDVPEDSAGADEVYGTDEEMAERAAEGYFVRDPERNLVHCPGGEILRQKCVKSNGHIRYANKSACRHCKDRNKCIHGSGGWKEIDFSKDCLEKPCKGWLGAEGKEPERRKAVKGKWHFERVKVVRLFLRPDRGKTAERMCLSEHPFGTIKRAMGSSYFLLKGMRKVTGEFALMCLGYNIKRAKSLLGFEKLMGLMVT